MAADTTLHELPSFDEIEHDIHVIEAAAADTADPAAAVAGLLQMGEAVIEHWVHGHGMTPTTDIREGFRLLALHRQGCKGHPSFNACRETARELAYHYNLISTTPDHPDTPKRIVLASMVAKHLMLFVSGKMRVAELGEFCCSSRPVRANDTPNIEDLKHA